MQKSKRAIIKLHKNNARTDKIIRETIRVAKESNIRFEKVTIKP